MSKVNCEWVTRVRFVRCYNMFDTGVGATNPVGIFARGVAPCGAFDLLGNVWEWTNSLYQEYPYQAEDGREATDTKDRRVVGGGSFHSYQNDVRCAWRDLNDPDIRSDNSCYRKCVQPYGASPPCGQLRTGCNRRHRPLHSVPGAL